MHAICTPSSYFSSHMQQLIKKNRLENEWIFDIIRNEHKIEPIQNCVIKMPEWTLVVHQSDSRPKYLVVFHDESLQSMRDLRGKHVPLLVSIYKHISAAFKANPQHFKLKTKPELCRIYFHYWPSVFQLHAHVVFYSSQHSNARCHEFKHVIRNLIKDGEWYSKAMMITPYNRTITSHSGGLEK